jgi:pimeloyl-ACP methyl ester carboxylesterase
MARLEVPTLVLFGTEDRLTPPELGRHYLAILARGQLVLIYDAAHGLDADRPEAFAAVVGDFIARHEGFVVVDQSGLRYR